MKFVFKSILLAVCLIFVACEEPLDRKPEYLIEEHDGMKFTFNIETAKGECATVYRVGEGIVSHFNVLNISSDTIYVSYSYSNPYTNDTFGAIFLDGYSLYRPIFNYDTSFVPCRHLAPGESLDWKLNNPEDDIVSARYLPAGHYYVDFVPNFAYHTACKCNLAKDAKDSGMKVVDLKRQMIEFDVVE